MKWDAFGCERRRIDIHKDSLPPMTGMSMQAMRGEHHSKRSPARPGTRGYNVAVKLNHASLKA